MEELIKEANFIDFDSEYQEDLKDTMEQGEDLKVLKIQKPKIPPLKIKTRKTPNLEAVVSPEKEERALPATMLTKNEKKELSKKIKEYTAELQKIVNEKYPDDYQTTPMLELAVTRQRA